MMRASGDTITVVSPSTGFSRTVTVGDDGSYRFSALPTGKYTVTRKAADGSTSSRDISVNIGTAATVSFVSAGGGDTTTLGAVTVTGSGFKILVPLTVLNHSSAAVVDPALPHRMGGAGTLVGGHLHKLAVHLFHAGQLQYAVKSRHKNTTVQNLHALNTLGGDLPVSRTVSFGVALFF